MIYKKKKKKWDVLMKMNKKGSRCHLFYITENVSGIYLEHSYSVVFQCLGCNIGFNDRDTHVEC